MKSHHTIFAYYTLFSIIIFSHWSCKNVNSYKLQNLPLSESPGPSDEDDPLRDSLKQDYFDKLYYATEGTNIDSIRAANLKRNIKRRNAKRQETMFRNNNENFANGQLVAQWHERGPLNEAGDVREVSYVTATNDIYALSTVGHLWKGNLIGGNWTLLDDANRYDTNVLHAMPHYGGVRIFAAYGSGNDDKEVRYSDDDGTNWTQGTGFQFYDHWGSARRFISLSDNETIFYLAHTWTNIGGWGEVVQLYVSTDKGVSYSKIWQSGFGVKVKEVDLWKAHDSDVLYLMDNDAQNFYTVTFDAMTSMANVSAATSYSGQGVSLGNFHLTGRWNSGNMNYDFFICTDTDLDVYKSTDGASWSYLSTASDNVWRKGWLANPNNDHLYVGSFQINLTTNTTQSNWQELYGQWWRYYSHSKDSLHVDIMNLDYYETAAGTPFILICNHSGIHVTYDNFVSTQNLGWNDFNIVTLYDQTTASDGFLYCGAQDKGTFTAGNSTGNFNALSTDNRSTGDGMMGVFFNSDNSYYGMIQNGQFAVFPNKNANNKTWYTIPGNHKPGWINPVIPTTDFTDNKAYMAGGNLGDGNGSYLILMDVTLNGNSVTFNPTQFNYDFRANSDDGSSVIKAIAEAPSDPDRLYVATEDATFFYSTDGGNNWTKSTTNLPSSLLPWDIIVDADDPDRVLICGTGNSNTGVYESTDGGDTFTALSSNIPSATFSEITFDDVKNLIFAATTDGPYVYAYLDNTWYSLMGSETPILNWNSVDNIGNDVIRFGTYGRGVWDFQIVTNALPVELIAFSAKSDDNKTVLINWETAQETGLFNFELQHSERDKTFETIATFDVNNQNQNSQFYKYLHADPLRGENLYRLKINNLDGSFEYSEIKTVNLNDEKNIFKIYPNPISENGNLVVDTKISTNYSISFFDVNGKLVFQQNNLNGKNTLQPNLISGSYFYTINDANELLKSGQLFVR